MSYVKKTTGGGGQIDPPPAGIGLMIIKPVFCQKYKNHETMLFKRRGGGVVAPDSKFKETHESNYLYGLSSEHAQYINV